ncbi:MAG TPA: hypothetical protein VF447_17555 [Terriglobales bacterium]
MSKRIYLVSYTPMEGECVWLVRAGTAAVARNYIAKRFLAVKVPTQDELIDAVQKRTGVEDASEDEQTSSEDDVTRTTSLSFQTAPPGDGGRNPGTVGQGEQVMSQSRSEPPETLVIATAAVRDIPSAFDRRVPRVAE